MGERRYVWQLEWHDVDPALHPFDAAAAGAVVRQVAPPLGGLESWQWSTAMGDALVARYGHWTMGWNHSRHHGGPVSAWCCDSHSVTGRDDTLDAVAASLCEWRGWLEELRERFERLLPLDDDGDDEGLLRSWEVAVAHLVTVVVGRTGAGGSWYSTCSMVLTWFLSAAGVPPQRSDELVETAIGGRFGSWVMPAGGLVTDVAERLAAGVTGVVPRDDDWPDTWPASWPDRRATNRPVAAAHPVRPAVESYRDDLSAWERAREAVDWTTATGPVTGPVRGDRDGIAEHAIERAAKHGDQAAAANGGADDGADDGANGGADGGDGGAARRMAAVLARVRADAEAGESLTFERLAGWQCTMLGIDEAPLRTGPAWAKDGRERYSWSPSLLERFAARLAEADDPAVPLPARAARVYLDVAFHHPFADGNARSAMLALYFVLFRDGVVLDRAAPLLMTVRQAGDELGAAGLAGFIEVLIEATRRRLATPPH